MEEGGKIIEIAGTTITENVTGNYDMFAKNIISNAGKSVHEQGEENGKVHGEPGEAPVIDTTAIEAKCIVQFRPHGNYNGEFGFDWVRFGDTGFKGDKWYRNIIGAYVADKTYPYQLNFVRQASKYGALMRTFKHLTIPWKPMVNKNPYLYTQAVMTLLPEHKAKLTLKVEIVEKPEKLLIRERKVQPDDPDCLSFNVTEVTIRDKKYDLADFLEITCLQSFTNHRYVDIIAVVGDEEKLAGTLKIFKNSKDIQKHVKLLFVRVKTAEGIGATQGEEERIKRYLKQAYVHAKVEYTTLDLTNDKLFNDEFKKSDLDFNLTAKIQEAMYSKLKNKTLGKGKVGNKYESYYRVYFVKKTVGNSSSGYLLGEAADLPCDDVLILDVKAAAASLKLPLSAVNNTVPHELFHAMGVEHTFDNHSDFVFKQYHTDNVMDYGDKSTGNIKGIFSFKWQWSILHDGIESKQRRSARFRKGK